MNPTELNTSPLQSPITTNPSANPAALPPEAAELLAKLHDISVPDTVTWWPLAPGWWLVIFTGIILIYGLFHLAIKLRRRNAYRRQALTLLIQLEPETSSQFASDVSALLKRVALSAYPKQKTTIAQAYGESWVNWLNQSCSEQIFQPDVATALRDAPYRVNIDFDAHNLKKCAKKWIQKHV